MNTQKLQQQRQDIIEVIVAKCKSEGVTPERAQLEVMGNSLIRFIDEQLFKADVLRVITSLELSANQAGRDIEDFKRGFGLTDINHPGGKVDIKD